MPAPPSSLKGQASLPTEKDEPLCREDFRRPGVLSGTRSSIVALPALDLAIVPEKETSVSVVRTLDGGA